MLYGKKPSKFVPKTCLVEKTLADRVFLQGNQGNKKSAEKTGKFISNR